MSADCYLTEKLVEYFSKNRPGVRFTQFLYNCLCDDKPKIADELLGSAYDFYYDERLTEEKWQMVRKWWDKECYA
jgi:hypothetical protein